jgi:hypothetical protein
LKANPSKIIAGRTTTRRRAGTRITTIVMESTLSKEAAEEGQLELEGPGTKITPVQEGEATTEAGASNASNSSLERLSTEAKRVTEQRQRLVSRIKL